MVFKIHSLSWTFLNSFKKCPWCEKIKKKPISKAVDFKSTPLPPKLKQRPFNWFPLTHFNFRINFYFLDDENFCSFMTFHWHLILFPIHLLSFWVSRRDKWETFQRCWIRKKSHISRISLWDWQIKVRFSRVQKCDNSMSLLFGELCTRTRMLEVQVTIFSQWNSFGGRRITLLSLNNSTIWTRETDV